MWKKLPALLWVRPLLVGLLLVGLAWCRAGAALAQDKAQLGKELVEAARNGEADRVKELLEQGADVATGDEKSGKTALHYAALRGDLEMVKLVLAKHTTATGVATFPDNDNDFPFHDAVRGGNIEVMKLLVTKEDANKADKHGNAMLHFAASKGNVELAQVLLDNGAEINAKDKSGYTPLHLAVQKDHLEMTQFLLGKGADAKAADGSGNSVLHFAVMRGNLDIAKLLIEKGADVNTKNGRGQTPLFNARTLELGQLLVEKGANVNETDNNVDTPMSHLRAFVLIMPDKLMEPFKFLLDKGANPNIVNKYGRSPLHLTVSTGMGFSSPELNERYASTVVTVCEALLDKNADVNAKSRDGLTPLRAAIVGGNPRVIELLKARGGTE